MTTAGSYLDNFKTQNIRVVVVYLYLSAALTVLPMMFSRGMYGSQYMLFLHEDLQTSALFANGMSTRHTQQQQLLMPTLLVVASSKRACVHVSVGLCGCGG